MQTGFYGEALLQFVSGELKTLAHSTLAGYFSEKRRLANDFMPLSFQMDESCCRVWSKGFEVI